MIQKLKFKRIFILEREIFLLNILNIHGQVKHGAILDKIQSHVRGIAGL